jgi:hypothetical protein
MTDPFTGTDWDAFAKDVQDGLLPKLSDSALGLCLVPTGRTDAKFAVELGFLVMMDKPIIAVIDPDTAVPAKLRAVADVLIIGRPDDPDFRAKFERAIATIMPEKP